MDSVKTSPRASRFRRIVLLFIVLLTTAMIFKRLFAFTITDASAPYPLRLLATAEPSTLLLLTLVLLVMLLVGVRRESHHGRGHVDQTRDERHEVV